MPYVSEIKVISEPIISSYKQTFMHSFIYFRSIRQSDVKIKLHEQVRQLDGDSSYSRPLHNTYM